MATACILKIPKTVVAGTNIAISNTYTATSAKMPFYSNENDYSINTVKSYQLCIPHLFPRNGNKESFLKKRMNLHLIARLGFTYQCYKDLYFKALNNGSDYVIIRYNKNDDIFVESSVRDYAEEFHAGLLSLHQQDAEEYDMHPESDVYKPFRQTNV